MEKLERERVRVPSDEQNFFPRVQREHMPGKVKDQGQMLFPATNQIKEAH